jgi:AcrR family transcriptional regulator
MVMKQSRSAPVMRAVLDAVVERLNDGDESLIRIPEICEATGVNYGSVYHHFGSRDGVIDAAYEMMFIEMANEDITTLRAISEQSTSLEEYMVAMQPLISRMAAQEDRRRRRAKRVRIVAAALTRPGLRELIGDAQAKVTNELVSVAQYGQDKGWLRSDVSAKSIAVLVQIVVFGRTLDDISAEPIDQGQWDLMVAALFNGLLARY